MNTPSIQQLEYQKDSNAIFEHIKHLPHAAWLDSGRPASDFGRFDILTAEPTKTISYQDGQTIIDDFSGNKGFSDRSPFEVLEKELLNLGFPNIKTKQANLPFIGGAVGYFSYDLARTIEKLPISAVNDYKTPDMLMGLYDWAVIQDHQERTCVLVSLPSIQSEKLEKITTLLNEHAINNDDEPFALTSPFVSNMQKTEYQEKFRRIQDYIVAGDVYQVNFAQRFSTAFTGSSLSAYRQLRGHLPSPFSAYFDIGNQQSILCFSPEKFITVDTGNNVVTKPIKGTRPRSDDSGKDHQLAETLINCEKDRAENLMIVDLLRNDIGKNCEPGSIQVPTLFGLESFPNVHHLVSTISGKLAQGHSVIELLSGCFPGGSITGAPKMRAMEIIEELEPHRRSIYCGSIGYIGVDGQVDTNIAIRTLLCESGKVHCWGGGGIVADSKVEAEHQEILDKISIIINTLEDL